MRVWLDRNISSGLQVWWFGSVATDAILEGRALAGDATGNPEN
jgi:hypothetical protein